jgi:hypothetical protein
VPFNEVIVIPSIFYPSCIPVVKRFHFILPELLLFRGRRPQRLYFQIGAFFAKKTGSPLWTGLRLYVQTGFQPLICIVLS